MLLPQTKGPELLGKALLGLVVAGLLCVVVYRLFFQGQDLARERGNRIVAEEQQRAEGRIVDGTMGAVKEREVYREHVTTVVREADEEIDHAWQGESVGIDVDRAGAAALCGLHDGLCRPAAAEAVQPLRETVPGGDAARTPSGDGR